MPVFRVRRSHSFVVLSKIRINLSNMSPNSAALSVLMHEQKSLLCKKSLLCHIIYTITGSISSVLFHDISGYRRAFPSAIYGGEHG